jgi:hypothetical protein
LRSSSTELCWTLLQLISFALAPKLTERIRLTGDRRHKIGAVFANLLRHHFSGSVPASMVFHARISALTVDGPETLFMLQNT